MNFVLGNYVKKMYLMGGDDPLLGDKPLRESTEGGFFCWGG